MKAWLKLMQKINEDDLKIGLTSFVNPYSMLILKNHPDIVDKIDNWFVDGESLVRSMNKDSKKTIKRKSFDDTSLAPVVFSFAKKKGLRVAIIGTKEEYIRGAVKKIEDRYRIKITYFRNGYFNDANEEKAAIDQIISQEIEMVVCGMGTPYQERFLINLKDAGWNGYGFTCGGFLHQIYKKEEYYPEILNDLNLRWLYRIIDEPKLFKRYFWDYPKFFVKFVGVKKALREKATKRRQKN